jgi:F0F1-type ATP synthase assembly protein I
LDEKPKRVAPLGGLGALVLVGQVGLIVAGAVLLGVLGGVYLDRAFGTRGIFVVAGALVGVGAGFAGVYGLLMRDIRWKR